MKSIIQLLLFPTLLLAASCSDDSRTTNGTGSLQDSLQQDSMTATAKPTLEKPDCPVSDHVLKGNLFWESNENLLVVIAASQETEDPDFGESHRLLEVYDGSNCQKIFREILPVNISPDFPYYLSKITYNKVSRIVAIQGFNQIYLFHLGERKLLGPFQPKFLNERYAEDAQTGMIDRLEVWENYLIGHANGMGAFVFDLHNPERPAPILPLAEYAVETGMIYNSLFLLNSADQNDGAQAIIPAYNADTEEFKINPLFGKPLKIEQNINPKVRNNRYLVLKEFTGANESRPVAIDMVKMTMLDLPPAIASKKTTDIIAWMKSQ
ncbi:MAG: hypothetical protein EPO28_00485 [Saprospiraceae bacterium]|nr:MAG: hypothetical protein EPO28_00485 [Saprospiraceae bacterium]